MKALCFKKNLRLREVPRPRRAPGWSLVRVLVAGVCNTDLELMKGYMHFSGIPGHEFVGRVEASDRPALRGRRVIGEINAGCGRCVWCARDLARHCPHRTTLGIDRLPGAFAEYLVLPDANLLAVPDRVPDQVAVFAEPLAAALEIEEQLLIPPAASVAVVGDGKLGLLVAWSLALNHGDLTLIGRHPERFAWSRLRGMACCSAARPPARRFDFVVDCTGSAAGWDLAVRLTRPRGVLVMKSTYSGAGRFNPTPLVVDEITLVGSRCGRFAPALHLLAGGQIDPRPLVEGTFDLADYREAFRHARRRGALKVLVRCS